MLKIVFLVELLWFTMCAAQWFPGKPQVPSCQIISRNMIGKGFCFPIAFCNYLQNSNIVQGDCPSNTCCFVMTSVPKPLPVCGKKGNSDLRITPRILGGDVTGENEFCWQVAVIDVITGRLLGGGSLIKENIILTAAHIVTGKLAMMIRVRVGDSDLISPSTCGIINVTQIIIHPEFNPANYQNDIALLRLDKDVDITSGCACLVCLPNSTNSSKDVVGKTCIASGYGSTVTPHGTNFPHHLNIVNVSIMDSNNCVAAIQKKRKQFVQHQSFMCALGTQGKDTCDGDGGGPVVCENGSGVNIQYGIISWGIGCGESGIPFVNIDVSVFLPWILQMADSNPTNILPTPNLNTLMMSG